ncbi:phospholipase D-like domain-containing protein [Natronospira sp.]|uniref:phospholipase D-like domain-containing protein n=1 Tax=Natronospira sp. TaxID=2024970 RepID=UPI003872E3C3
MSFQDLLPGWPVIAGLLSVALALIASGHAILNKSDHRATVGWVGVIWLAPVLGSLLYLLFGINRIRRRASSLREPLNRVQGESDLGAYSPEALESFVPEALQPLSRLSSQVALQPLLGGNAVSALVNGDEAYPAMLAAIEGAQHSIGLSTYIFNRDRVGRRFVDALARAVDRGVEVRVLVDAVGLRYSLPTIEGLLRRERIPFARFMPPRWPWTLPFVNLRNHRKLLVVDGATGFVGGMNIAEGNCVAENPAHAVRDLHFRVEGPLVSELQAVFVEDWQFSCGESLSGSDWFPAPETPGAVLGRVIADGPDERYDTIRQVMLGAVSLARFHIRIQTPYFLPDKSLADSLITAALRGVVVDVIVPEQNNLPFVDWAMQAQIAPLLRRGVRISRAPGVFDHSKLMTVDGQWAFVGSANWDPRSLSLNFECNLECYDAWTTSELERFFDHRLWTARSIEAQALQTLPWLKRLRNGLARLLTPYM